MSECSDSKVVAAYMEALSGYLDAFWKDGRLLEDDGAMEGVASSLKWLIRDLSEYLAGDRDAKAMRMSIRDTASDIAEQHFDALVRKASDLTD